MTASNRNAVTICVKRWRGSQREKSNFWVVFFVAKRHESGRFSGKKCEPSGAHFQENTLGAKGQGANMLIALPVISTHLERWSAV